MYTLTMQLSKKTLITVYLGSFFLAPFSLYWFFKYIKNPATKKVAYISLLITTLSIAIGIYTGVLYVQAVDKYTDEYSKNLQIYKDLGY